MSNPQTRPSYFSLSLQKTVYKEVTNKLKGKELELLVAIFPNNNDSLYGVYSFSFSKA